jgi:hypothetical protein
MRLNNYSNPNNHALYNNKAYYDGYKYGAFKKKRRRVRQGFATYIAGVSFLAYSLTQRYP